MSESRQGADFFWFLFGKYPAGNWRFPSFLKLKLWKSDYFIHDSFGVYWNRFIACRFGHKKLDMVDEGDGLDRIYCFACNRFIYDKEEIT